MIHLAWTLPPGFVKSHPCFSEEVKALSLICNLKCIWATLYTQFYWAQAVLLFRRVDGYKLYGKQWEFPGVANYNKLPEGFLTIKVSRQPGLPKVTMISWNMATLYLWLLGTFTTCSIFKVGLPWVYAPCKVILTESPMARGSYRECGTLTVLWKKLHQNDGLIVKNLNYLH